MKGQLSRQPSPTPLPPDSSVLHSHHHLPRAVWGVPPRGFRKALHQLPRLVLTHLPYWGTVHLQRRRGSPGPLSSGRTTLPWEDHSPPRPLNVNPCNPGSSASRGWAWHKPSEPTLLPASQQLPGPKAFLLWAQHSSSFCSQEEVPTCATQCHPSSLHGIRTPRRPWALGSGGQTHLQAFYCLIPAEMLFPSVQLGKSSGGSDTEQAQGRPGKHVAGEPPAPPRRGKSAGIQVTEEGHQA